MTPCAPRVGSAALLIFAMRDIGNMSLLSHVGSRRVQAFRVDKHAGGCAHKVHVSFAVTEEPSILVPMSAVLRTRSGIVLDVGVLDVLG